MSLNVTIRAILEAQKPPVPESKIAEIIEILAGDPQVDVDPVQAALDEERARLRRGDKNQRKLADYIPLYIVNDTQRAKSHWSYAFVQLMGSSHLKRYGCKPVVFQGNDGKDWQWQTWVVVWDVSKDEPSTKNKIEAVKARVARMEFDVSKGTWPAYEPFDTEAKGSGVQPPPPPPPPEEPENPDPRPE